MTDRINMLTVVLNADIREDDCEPLIQAILQLKGVLSVSKNVSDVDDHLAYIRARSDLTQKLFDILSPIEKY